MLRLQRRSSGGISLCADSFNHWDICSRITSSETPKNLIARSRQASTSSSCVKESTPSHMISLSSLCSPIICLEEKKESLQICRIPKLQDYVCTCVGLKPQHLTQYLITGARCKLLSYHERFCRHFLFEFLPKNFCILQRLFKTKGVNIRRFSRGDSILAALHFTLQNQLILKLFEQHSIFRAVAFRILDIKHIHLCAYHNNLLNILAPYGCCRLTKNRLRPFGHQLLEELRFLLGLEFPCIRLINLLRCKCTGKHARPQPQSYWQQLGKWNQNEEGKRNFRIGCCTNFVFAIARLPFYFLFNQKNNLEVCRKQPHAFLRPMKPMDDCVLQFSPKVKQNQRIPHCQDTRTRRSTILRHRGHFRNYFISFATSIVRNAREMFSIAPQHRLMWSPIKLPVAQRLLETEAGGSGKPERRAVEAPPSDSSSTECLRGRGRPEGSARQHPPSIEGRKPLHWSAMNRYACLLIRYTIPSRRKAWTSRPGRTMTSNIINNVTTSRITKITSRISSSWSSEEEAKVRYCETGCKTRTRNRTAKIGWDDCASAIALRASEKAGSVKIFAHLCGALDLRQDLEQKILEKILLPPAPRVLGKCTCSGLLGPWREGTETTRDDDDDAYRSCSLWFCAVCHKFRVRLGTDGTGPRHRLPSQLPPDIRGPVQAVDSAAGRSSKENMKRVKHCTQSPRRLPQLRMVGRSHTDFLADFKPRSATGDSTAMKQGKTQRMQQLPVPTYHFDATARYSARLADSSAVVRVFHDRFHPEKTKNYMTLASKTASADYSFYLKLCIYRPPHSKVPLEWILQVYRCSSPVGIFRRLDFLILAHYAAQRLRTTSAEPRALELIIEHVSLLCFQEGDCFQKSEKDYYDLDSEFPDSVLNVMWILGLFNQLLSNFILKMQYDNQIQLDNKITLYWSCASLFDALPDLFASLATALRALNKTGSIFDIRLARNTLANYADDQATYASTIKQIRHVIRHLFSSLVSPLGRTSTCPLPSSELELSLTSSSSWTTFNTLKGNVSAHSRLLHDATGNEPRLAKPRRVKPLGHAPAVAYRHVSAYLAAVRAADMRATSLASFSGRLIRAGLYRLLCVDRTDSQSLREDIQRREMELTTPVPVGGYLADIKHIEVMVLEPTHSGSCVRSSSASNNTIEKTFSCSFSSETAIKILQQLQVRKTLDVVLRHCLPKGIKASSFGRFSSSSCCFGKVIFSGEIKLPQDDTELTSQRINQPMRVRKFLLFICLSNLRIRSNLREAAASIGQSSSGSSKGKMSVVVVVFLTSPISSSSYSAASRSSSCLSVTSSSESSSLSLSLAAASSRRFISSFSAADRPRRFTTFSPSSFLPRPHSALISSSSAPTSATKSSGNSSNFSGFSSASNTSASGRNFCVAPAISSENATQTSSSHSTTNSEKQLTIDTYRNRAWSHYFDSCFLDGNKSCGRNWSEMLFIVVTVHGEITLRFFLEDIRHIPMLTRSSSSISSTGFAAARSIRCSFARTSAGISPTSIHNSSGFQHSEKSSVDTSQTAMHLGRNIRSTLPGLLCLVLRDSCCLYYSHDCILREAVNAKIIRFEVATQLGQNSFIQFLRQCSQAKDKPSRGLAGLPASTPTPLPQLGPLSWLQIEDVPAMLTPQRSDSRDHSSLTAESSCPSRVMAPLGAYHFYLSRHVCRRPGPVYDRCRTFKTTTISLDADNISKIMCELKVRQLRKRTIVGTGNCIIDYYANIQLDAPSLLTHGAQPDCIQNFVYWNPGVFSRQTMLICNSPPVMDQNSISTLWQSVQAEGEDVWYRHTLDYWSTQEPSVDGVLAGQSAVSTV
eukprot:284816559_5